MNVQTNTNEMKPQSNLQINMVWLSKILSGPIVFIIISMLNLHGMPQDAKYVLGVYAWVIIWWILQPVPWGITSMLPIPILPLLGVAKLGDVATAYGQKVIFFLIPVLLVGYAVQKHGLGRRIALAFISNPLIGNSIHRVLFSFMVVTGFISTFVDDAACVAMMMPIGMAIVAFAVDPKGEGKEYGNVGVFMALGVMYASIAGGIATLMGRPHHAVSLSFLEQFNNMTIDFVQFSKVAILVSIASLLVYYLILFLFIKPEIKQVAGAREYFLEERRKMGPFKPGERNTVIVLAVMALLWLAPTFFDVKIDNFVPPTIGLLLLYLLPISPDKKEATCTVEDFQRQVPWNVIFLAIAGPALSQIAVKFGVLDYIQVIFEEMVSGTGLILAAGIGGGVLTNFVSGIASVTMLDTILLPLSSNVGIDPEVIARITSNLGVGFVFPWAGATAALAFAAGNMKIKTMMKIGIVALSANIVVVTLLNVILVPLFK